MPKRAIEWTVRMVMLVLAGLVTLSILGSIAAMSNDAASEAGGYLVDRATPPPPPDEASSREPGNENRDVPAEGNDAAGIPAEAEASAAGGRTAPAPQRPDHERWLEAIAYALLALAGLLALAILLLWRGLRHVRRIADAAEGRPRNH